MTVAAVSIAPADPEATSDARSESSRAVPGSIKAQVLQLLEQNARQADQIAAMQDAQAKQETDLAELRSQLGRLAGSLGRSDVMTPAATVEQLKAAYTAGQHLHVLKDCKMPGGVNFIAGTKIEARQYPLERLLELVERGQLAVSVVKA